MPPASKPLLGIIGGAGRMGRWFKRAFEAEGYEVLIADRGTPLTGKDLARRCDVVFVSVPMSVFEEVVREVGPFLSPEQGLVDFCSLKKTQNEAMLSATKAEVVAAHPLFGPAEKDLSGLKVALWPSRGRRWYAWFKGFLEDQGAKTIEIDPESHDRIMAIVQVINHFMLLGLGRLMEESGLSLEDIKALATPSFERQLEILSRFADQDPYLYGLIQFDNPEGETMRNTYLEKLRELAQIASQKDLKAFVKIFREVQKIGRELRAGQSALP